MINGPYDANDATRAYLDQINQLGPRTYPPGAGLGSLGLSQEQTYPPGAGPSAKDIALKQAFIEREMAAQRSHELSQIAQSLEHLRQRLLAIDMPGNAERLNDTIIDLMQHWLDERWQR